MYIILASGSEVAAIFARKKLYCWFSIKLNSLHLLSLFSKLDNASFVFFTKHSNKANSFQRNVMLMNIKKSTFYFHDAKERVRVAAKHRLVIKSAAPYCRELTKRKLTNATMKKKFA